MSELQKGVTKCDAPKGMPNGEQIGHRFIQGYNRKERCDHGGQQV
jgi:hypothetical protein